ncbi:MAG: hypothetical protein GY847_33120 [Proteobacteria bacterium]|nr:hypothetical protein [Pseudomonadota bacterium]
MAILKSSAPLVGCSSPSPTPALWDYVALGDSIPAGYGVGKSYVTYYAEYIEADLGVTVTVHNWAVSGQTTRKLLMDVQNNQELWDAISEAEVITIWTGWNDVTPLIGLERYNVESKCGDGENLDMDCVREGVEALEADIDALLTEILSLQSVDDALIRIADSCNHFVGEWKEAGVYQEFKGPVFEDWSNAIAQIASKHDVSIVHTYPALNGQNGDQEIAAEYLWLDGIHFSAEGHTLIANLHRDLGYEH